MLLSLVALGFASPLIKLFRFARHSELFSHILLVPFVSGYLVWLCRHEIVRTAENSTSRKMDFVVRAIGWTILAAAGFGVFLVNAELHMGWKPVADDYLAAITLPFILLVCAVPAIVLNASATRRLLFPLAFLLFMVPFPVFIQNGIEWFFQHTSAVAASGLIQLSGLPVLRVGMHLSLPGVYIEVGQQCSGIHSSLVLFITAVLAGHMLLRQQWRKWLLVLFVIPLAIVRNGFRIFVIAQLCVRFGPHMIDSWIHRHGGFVFFLASLIPFFLVLAWLRKSEPVEAFPS